ncbi:hypothetical protein CSHISOI_11573, partial [Colletotrichum shisoi]
PWPICIESYSAPNSKAAQNLLLATTRPRNLLVRLRQRKTQEPRSGILAQTAGSIQDMELQAARVMPVI